MKKFEYETITFPQNPTKEQLNKVGSAGWELCSVITNPHSPGVILYFKREVN